MIYNLHQDGNVNKRHEYILKQTTYNCHCKFYYFLKVENLNVESTIPSNLPFVFLGKSLFIDLIVDLKFT